MAGYEGITADELKDLKDRGFVEGEPGDNRPEGNTVSLAQSYLDRKDEDWTYVDPEDIRRLARAVLSK